MLYNAFKMLYNAFASGFFCHKNAKVFELFITKNKVFDRTSINTGSRN